MYSVFNTGIHDSPSCFVICRNTPAHCHILPCPLSFDLQEACLLGDFEVQADSGPHVPLSDRECSGVLPAADPHFPSVGPRLFAEGAPPRPRLQRAVENPVLMVPWDDPLCLKKFPLVALPILYLLWVKTPIATLRHAPTPPLRPTALIAIVA